MENGSDEIDFAVLRRKDNGRYRQLCRDASKVIEVPYLEKVKYTHYKKEILEFFEMDSWKHLFVCHLVSSISDKERRRAIWRRNKCLEKMDGKI